MTSTDWSESQKERTERINTLLNYMCCNASLIEKETGRVPQYSLDEIADFCGCDVMAIKKIETKALRKLRSKNPKLKLYLPDA